MNKEMITKYLAKSAAETGKVLKCATKKYNDWQIPSSMNWLFAFGFKIGLLLANKSFLIIR